MITPSVWAAWARFLLILAELSYPPVMGDIIKGAEILLPKNVQAVSTSLKSISGRGLLIR